MARLDVIRKYRKINNDRDPIEYIKSRIKSEESMKEKLKRKGLEVKTFISKATEHVVDIDMIKASADFLLEQNSY